MAKVKQDKSDVKENGDVIWAFVRYLDDDLISKVLKGENITTEDGGTVQQGGSSVGDECLAPWGKQHYMAELLFLSDKHEEAVKARQEAHAKLKQNKHEEAVKARQEAHAKPKQSVAVAVESKKAEKKEAAKKTKTKTPKQVKTKQTKLKTLTETEARARAQEAMFLSKMKTTEATHEATPEDSSDSDVVEVKRAKKRHLEFSKGDYQNKCKAVKYGTSPETSDVNEDVSEEEMDDWKDDQIKRLSRHNASLLKENSKLEKQLEKMTKASTSSSDVLTPTKIKVLKTIVDSVEKKETKKFGSYLADKRSTVKVESSPVAASLSKKNPVSVFSPSQSQSAVVSPRPNQMPASSPQPSKLFACSPSPVAAQMLSSVTSSSSNAKDEESYEVSSAREVLNMKKGMLKVLRLQFKDERKLLNSLLKQQWTREQLAKSSALGSRVATNSASQAMSQPLPPLEFNAIKTIVCYLFPITKVGDLNRYTNSLCSSCRPRK